MLTSNRNLRRQVRALLAGISLAAVAASTDCLASPATGDGPNFDANGVDIISLQIQIPDPLNSFKIGPNLSYEHTVSTNVQDVLPDVSRTRLIDNSGSITISQEGIYIVGSEMQYFNLDTATNKFWSTLNDKSYIVRQGTDEYVYFRPDGAQITFKSYHGINVSGNGGKIINIKFPNGLVIVVKHRLSDFDPTRTDPRTKSYYVVGPQTISDNQGYLIQFEYQGDVDHATGYSTITAVNGYNLATDACYVGALHCPVIPGRPKVTFQYATGSLVATNANGSVSRFYTEGTASNTTFQTLHVQFPDGFAAGYDNTTIKVSSGGVSSLTRGSATWVYSISAGPTNDTRINKVTDPSGSITSYLVRYSPVDKGNRVYTQTNSLNRTTTYSYDSLWNLTRTTLPEGNYVQLTRDANANVVQSRQVSKTPGTPPDIVNAATFPSTCANLVSCHLPLTTTDPRGNVTGYTYDQTHGGMTSATLPAPSAIGIRPEVRIAYTQVQASYKNSAGTIAASGLPIYVKTSQSQCRTTATCAGTDDETKATLDYGPQTAGVANNLLPVSAMVSSGDGLTSSTVSSNYDAQGNIAITDGALAGSIDTTVYRYDVMGRAIGKIQPDPDGTGPLQNAATRVTINDSSRSVKTEVGTTAGQSDAAWQGFAPAQSTEVKTGTTGLIESETLAAGTTPVSLTQYSYDANERLDCIAVRMNPSVYGSLPASACTATADGGQGADRLTKATYNSAGDVTQVQKGYGSARVVSEVTAYTPNGKTAYVADGNSNRTTYEYDGHDRLVKTNYPVSSVGSNTSSTSDYKQLTYDANSNITQRRLRDGSTITFAYDNLNRPTSRTPSGDNVVNYTYNLTGNLTQLQRPGDGVTLDLAYDALGRKLSESLAFGWAAYQYDSAGRLTRITWPDGFYATYDYDVTGNVTAIRENGATSGIGVLAIYTYDNLGRRTGITRGNGTSTSYAFDPVSRLSSTTQDLAGTTSDQTIGSIAYNPASQIQSQIRSNDAYAWTDSYNVDRGYTVNGLNQHTASGATALGYDGQGNLTTSGSSTYTYGKLSELKTAPGVSMYYDPGGRLIEYDTSVSTRFYYAGSAMIAEIANPTGAILRRYVPGPGMDEPVVWYEGSGISDRRWLHADERGSVIAVSDGSGAKVGVNRYDEYGIPQSTNVGRFQYTGQVWLQELGMYYYKARIYSPTLGRFMQTDPIEYGDGLNWYSYAQNDPINGVDPSGNGSQPWDKSTILTSTYGDQIPSSGSGSGVAAGPGPWSFNPFARSGSAPPSIFGSIPQYHQGELRASYMPQNQNAPCRTVKSGSTVQLGLGAQGTWGIFSYQFSGGLALDTHGNVALYGSGGPGGGLGGGGDAGLTVQVSNAPSIQDLAGPFLNGSVGGGAIGGGTIDGFTGFSRNGQRIGGGGFTAGAAVGETSFLGVTNTFVSPSLNFFGQPTC